MPWMTGVEILCAAGADPNAQNKLGETILYLALNERGEEPDAILDFLLRHGADPNIPSLDGSTPLELAARAGRTQAVRKLLEYGAEANPATNDDNDVPGGLPLQQACLGGHADIIEILLDAGANPNLPDSTGMTTFDYIKEILPGLISMILATQAHEEDPLPLVRIEDLKSILDQVQGSRLSQGYPRPKLVR